MAFVIIDDPVGGASTTLRCGQNNTAPAGYSGVLAGRCNTSSGAYSIIGGGFKNTTNASYSSIFAGNSNFILTSSNSSIGNGFNNTINSTGKYNNIVGGSLNKILLNGSYAFIGGGGQNTADALYATVTAGRENTISCTQSSLSTYSIINGGYLNQILGSQSSNIDGGTNNLIRKINGSPNNNVIDGGGNNTIIDQNYSTIGGGYTNLLQGVGSWNLIAGGRANSIDDIAQTTSYSNIGGGTLNSLQGSFSVIAGGDSNTIDSERSAILGGSTNVIDNTGNWNAIIGGKGNTVSGNYSMIFSSASVLTADNSVILGGTGIVGNQSDTVYVPNLNIQVLGGGSPVNNLGVDASGNVVIGSTPQDIFITGGTLDYTTGELTLDNNNATQVVIGGFHDYFLTGLTFDNGTFLLSAEMNDGNTYVADLSILASDMTVTGGTYNPITGTATFTTNSGNTFDVTGFLTGYTDIYLTGASYNSGTGVLTLTNTDGSTVTATGFSTGGSSGLILAGSCFRSACLTNAFNSACLISSITLGECNTISAGGGTSSDCGNSILGGKNNTVLSSNCSIIAGGSSNTMTAGGSSSSILGGNNNKLTGIATAIINGAGNYVGGNFNFAGNGQANCLIGGQYSSIINGLSNKLGSDYSYIGGGNSNTIEDIFIIGVQPYKTIGNGALNTIGTNSGYATIMNGNNNQITGNGPGNTILSGNQNKILTAKYSTIAGGNCNSIQITINDCTGFIGGGTCNKILGDQSFIAGGCRNTVRSFDSCVFIAGSNITSNKSCTTFVNNLSIMNIPTSNVGLPSGSVWRCTVDNILRIVP